MPCFHPLEAWQTFEGDIHFYARGTSGKKGGKAPNYRRQLRLPCGRCIGCRLERSKQWALRLMHEAQLHERTAFVTLTYDDSRMSGDGAPTVRLSPEPLTRSQASAVKSEDRTDSTACKSGGTRASPSSYVVDPGTRLTLHYPHVQKFLRSLRKELRKRRGLQGKIRFYMCGEYGDQLGRPHYHVCLFGEDFREDRYEWRRKGDTIYYRSPLLEKHWPHGNSEIGNLTIESAAYVARYVMKKMTGEKAHDHYRRIDLTTGTEYWLTPEFNVMSRKPGIGKGWFDQYRNDVYPDDAVTHGGIRFKPPRYYDKLLKLLDTELYEEIEQARIMGHHSEDDTPARLAVRENVLRAKLAFKKRDYET